MPGIDFNRVRAEITMEQVLNLLRFEPTSRRGPQWYGACPLHETSSRRKRSHCFSVNVALGCYYCHRCHRHGNPLELWADATGQSLHRAAIDLYRQLGRAVPWIYRW
jgi:hypothetical protein